MPRTKGSKNKQKTVVNKDYAALIAEKSGLREQLISETESLTAELSEMKVQLKGKKTALKKLEKEIAGLEGKKAEEEMKAAEEAKKEQIGHVVQQLLENGLSVEEILAKLK